MPYDEDMSKKKSIMDRMDEEPVEVDEPSDEGMKEQLLEAWEMLDTSQKQELLYRAEELCYGDAEDETETPPKKAGVKIVIKGK